MGYYIETGTLHEKAEIIKKKYGAKLITREEAAELVKDPLNGVVCIMDNGAFEAAGFAFNESEFAAFARPDPRPRQWLRMNRKRLCELTGFREQAAIDWAKYQRNQFEVQRRLSRDSKGPNKLDPPEKSE